MTVFTVFVFFKWGVPWTSEKFAYALPAKTNQLMSANTLEMLDKLVFTESVINNARQEEIRQHFYSKIVPLSEGKNITYRLHFRAWDNIPNALALPSGDIVLTDRLIELCKTQAEMDSILLHEMGHIEYKHSLRTLIEGSITSIAVMMIMGDSNGLADLGVGLGAFMVSSAYSREHELEADTYGFKHMLTAKIDPKSFSDIMSRITSNEKLKVPVNKDQDNSKNRNESSILDYFSSHPNTQERMKNAQQYSVCFKKGMSKCDITSIPK